VYTYTSNTEKNLVGGEEEKEIVNSFFLLSDPKDQTMSGRRTTTIKKMTVVVLSEPKQTKKTQNWAVTFSTIQQKVKLCLHGENLEPMVSGLERTV
jgi:hypothetical protein